MVLLIKFTSFGCTMMTLRSDKLLHIYTSYLEVRPELGDDFVDDEISDIHAEKFEDEAAVGPQQLVSESRLEQCRRLLVFVVVFQIVVEVVVDVQMTMQRMLTSMMRLAHWQMIADKFAATEVRIGPNPLDERD